MVKIYNGEKYKILTGSQSASRYPNPMDDYNKCEAPFMFHLFACNDVFLITPHHKASDTHVIGLITYELAQIERYTKILVIIFKLPLIP